jgi:hypothetical protein
MQLSAQTLGGGRTGNKMPLYTIILDWEGGTYISQERAHSHEDALKKWARDLDTDPIESFGPSSHKQLVSSLKGDPSTPLDGLVNAWCQDAVLNGKLALINVVRTEV